MPSFVCFQASFFVHNLLVRNMLFTFSLSRPSVSLHASWHFEAELNSRYTREWKGHSSWYALRALGKRSQRQRRAFEPDSALRLGLEERGQAGRIEFFWKKSIHLSAPAEHKRSSEPCLKGIRASKEHICVSCNCSSTVSSLRERPHCTRPTHLPHSASSRKIQEC